MVSMMIINQAETLANSIANSVKMEVSAGAMNNVNMAVAEKSQSVKGLTQDVMAALSSNNNIRG